MGREYDPGRVRIGLAPAAERGDGGEAGGVAEPIPQRPDDLVVEVEEADAEAVSGAVERGGRPPVAGRARRRWSALGAGRGRRRLAGAADEVTGLMVREVGKPITEAAAEVGRGVGILRYYAQQALDPDGETYPGPSPAGLLLARRRPRGVAGLITPWNFPVAIPLWKAAPALAYAATCSSRRRTPPGAPCAWPSCWPSPSVTTCSRS